MHLLFKLLSTVSRNGYRAQEKLIITSIQYCKTATVCIELSMAKLCRSVQYVGPTPRAHALEDRGG